MGQLSYRANLTAAEFPLLSEFQGRSVIISGTDQNFSRQLNSVKNKDRDVGIPQIYYGHNVVPTDAGMEAVGYLQITKAPADSDGTFSDTFVLRDISEHKAYFANTASGRCYVLVSELTGWLRTTDKTPAAGHMVTVAHVNGVSYICFGGIGTFVYNFTTNMLDAATLTATDPALVLGICAANGYLIAWTTTDVVWSSIVDPTDFTPSLVTGAGGGAVQSIKSSITVCLPHSSGFIVYTKNNAVPAAYTGNGQYPFAIKELVGSGGVASLSLVSYDADTPDHYAYTTAGLQVIGMSSASVILPQVTDFLAGSKFEDFDDVNNIFNITYLSLPMQKKLTVISNRYLVISYGISSLTHALIYDYALQRWGKLKVAHVDCFDYSVLGSAVVETPKRSIGFLQADGTIKVVVMSYDTTGSNGVIVLGKYQLERNNYLTLDEIHLENIKSGADLSVKVLTSIDGKNTTQHAPVLADAVGNYRRYNNRSTGLNHSIVIRGAFHASSLILKFTSAGDVR